ncbi:MAG: trigger factor [Methylophilaceae bacterium]|nr:trigger factor [Methylophilaceae bacterium]
MAASVETISNIERRMTIKVPLAPLEAQIKKRLVEIARTAKFSGFRPGKAPIGLINQHYGAQARDEVYSKAVETSFGDAVQENKLRVAGFPNIEHKPFAEAATDLEYVATFEIIPEIKVGDVKKIKVEKPTLTVGKKDVDKTIDVLKKQRVSYTPVKRASKKEDRINIDLTASIDGEQVESTNNKGMDIVLGEVGRIAAFDQELTGGKAGETRTFDIEYPKDHNPAQLAGKKVNYSIVYNSVSQPSYPDVDEAFAQSLGVDDGDVNKLRAEIKSSLVQEVEKRVKSRVKEQVFQGLVEVTELEVPKTIISSEIERMMQMTAQNLQQRGMDPKSIQLQPQMFEEQAKRSASLRLILSELVNAENLQATADQVKAMVEAFAQNYEQPAQMVDWYYADVKRLDEPAALATEDNVVEWVLAKAKITESKIKFDELMAG